MPPFEIQADIFTRLPVFDSPKGSSDTFKTRQNISLYFKRRYLIIYNSSISLGSYFRADHLILYPSIPLASYFCAVHPLGELFSYRPWNSPSVHFFLVSYFCAVHPLDELFYCDHLVLHPLASYFRANH